MLAMQNGIKVDLCAKQNKQCTSSYKKLLVPPCPSDVADSLYVLLSKLLNLLSVSFCIWTPECLNCP